MSTRTRNPSSSRLLACLVLLTGCDLSVDLSLIRAGDAGEQGEGEGEPDAEKTARDAEGPDRDAEHLPRDGGGTDDAGTELDASRDAGPDPELDGEVRDAQERDVEVPVVDCTGDGDCAADLFCAAGECRARCDANDRCAGPVVGRNVEQLAAVGDTVYWSTPVETDTLGNPIGHGRIWSWRRDAPLTSAVQRELGTLLFVIDDFIYLLRPAALAVGAEPTVLMRKSLGNPEAAAEQVATGVRKVWHTRDHVVWSHREGDAEELWRLRRMPGSVPERLLVTTEGQWTDSNATFAVKLVDFVPTFQFVIVRLSDHVVHGIVGGGNGSEGSAADEDYFYFQRNNEIRRVPFSDLSQELILATGLRPGARCVPSGGWVYWYGDTSGPRTVYGRTQRDALLPPQELPVGPPFAAVIKNEVIHVDYDTQRIFIEPMPSLPCSSNMPCPADMSCGASMFCE